MDLYELEHEFLQATDAWQSDDISNATLIDVGEQIVEKLRAIGGQDAETLAYRVRLGTLPARSLGHGMSHYTELKELLALHESDRARYPAHPNAAAGQQELVDAGGKPLHDLLHGELHQIVNIPQDVNVPAETIMEALALADRYLSDDEARHIRITVLQVMDRADEVVGMLSGYLTPYEQLDDDADLSRWLHKHDVAAMAYLETSNWEYANLVLDEMAKAGSGTGYMPAVCFAESLIPMAEHTSLEKSVNRARHVLRNCAGCGGLRAAPMVQTATFLMLGGLNDKALALLEQTESTIEQPAAVLNDLLHFFRAAVQMGSGDVRMPRFGSPRWQEAVGIDPQRVTCAELAEACAVPAYQQAEEFDRRNGTTTRVAFLNRTLSAPALEPHYFDETCLEGLAPLAQPPAYPRMDEDLDPDVQAIVDVFTTPRDDDEPYPELPDFMRDDDKYMRLRGEMMDDDQLRGEDAAQQLAAYADDPSLDPRLRSVIEVDLLNAARYLNRPVHATAMRALPTVTRLNPQFAVIMGMMLLMGLHSRNELRTPAAQAIGSYTAGLIACGYGNFTAGMRMDALLSQAGRLIEAKSALDDAARCLAADPDVVDDPQVARIDIARSSSLDLAALNNYAEAGAEAAQAAIVAHSIGDVDSTQILIAYAVDNYYYAGEYHTALDWYNRTQLETDPAPSAEAQFEVLAAGLRIVTLMDSEVFDQMWPSLSEMIKQPAQQWAEADENILFYNRLSRLVDDVSELLARIGKLKEAREFTAWVAQHMTTAPHVSYQGDALVQQAAIFASSGMHNESALVLESLVQRAQAAGDLSTAQRGHAVLEFFAGKHAEAAGSIYTDALAANPINPA
ncbi:hypothetical protein [Corynebacterium cystitidis]|uniref:hypothetical protein n=1 Tax=Corynebacterium cystitidis TaxID=35757 RepID=UPI00211E6D46|nr:hypothetical protein [Corynebacterium cystitidis]